MTEIKETEFLMDKRDFVLASATLGAAIKFICHKHGHSPEEWVEFFIEVAEGKVAQQSPEFIDELVDQYYIARENHAQAMTIKIH
ncbi:MULTISPECIES: hypothetical protein [unclassified Nodularia (in: cyanobacteria)]|uniref:hypothetical protein n=1 Tax=unclassified Nodularia (in: cyanobacteria) TaxID=2656917 RepID=UPI00187F1AD1|nr:MULTISPECIES: hypothetical protein [unclassified Nodularia (in: cyanobacteria)]MBE9199452.1 hypothetical protein [Nodularia sp. LEGE 06071]MCC2695178.1 hypothetical protein [Nodularia sp. LEGE 04288]